MSHKFHAIVRPAVLEDFNDEMNPLRVMLQEHFTPISENPENEAIQSIIDTSILKDYGEALTNGLRRHLHEKCGFLLTSMEFKGFHSTPNNEDNYCLEVSLNKGDIHLLDFYILDEDLDEAIKSDILNDLTGVYQHCPNKVSEWRVKSPEQRSAADRGILLGAASSKDWSHDIDFKELKNKISRLKPQLNPKAENNKSQEFKSMISDFSI